MTAAYLSFLTFFSLALNEPTVQAVTAPLPLAASHSTSQPAQPGARASSQPTSNPATKPAIQALVDPRVELMSIIFRLAGNPEYNMQNSNSPYADEVEDQFGRFRNHPVVRLARQLRRDHGVSYDAVMSMAVHLVSPQHLALRTPFGSPDFRLDARWTRQDARDFLAKADAFVKQSDFVAFTKRHADFYSSAAASLNATLGSQDLQRWFDDYMGSRSPVEFHLVVGLLNGGGCYGCSLKPKDRPLQMYSIIGAWSFDRQGLPIWPQGSVSTIVHEFCHSYTNVLVDRHWKELQAAADRIFPTCKEEMNRQAYGNSKTVIYESMVRACTLRHTAAARGTIAGWVAGREEAGRGFIWVPDLAGLLANEYEKHRATYPTLDSFMPRVARFFTDYADKLPR